MLIKYRNPDLGLLIVRLALALIFFCEVWTKTHTLTQVTMFFAKIGLPHFMVYFIIFVEFIGALVFLLGVFTEWGYVIAIEMAVIIVKLQWPRGPLGYMAELMILSGALLIALCGPGKYSLLNISPVKE